jgi:hypothetical protein
MGRLNTKTRRLTEESARAILHACYGSLSGYWRRHLAESGVTLAEFSSCVKRDPTTPEVEAAVLDTMRAAALDRPFKAVVELRCAACHADLGVGGAYVAEYLPEDGVWRIFDTAGDHQLSLAEYEQLKRGGAPA